MKTKTKVLKLDPSVFRLAAEIALNDGCHYGQRYLCNALANIFGDTSHRCASTRLHVKFLTRFFKPRTPPPDCSFSGFWGPSCEPSNQEARCMAALLCALMIKDGIRA